MLVVVATAFAGACRSHTGANEIAPAKEQTVLHLTGAHVHVFQTPAGFVEVRRREIQGTRVAGGCSVRDSLSSKDMPAINASYSVESDPTTCTYIFAYGYQKTPPPTPPGNKIDSAATVRDVASAPEVTDSVARRNLHLNTPHVRVFELPQGFVERSRQLVRGYRDSDGRCMFAAPPFSNGDGYGQVVESGSDTCDVIIATGTMDSAATTH